MNPKSMLLFVLLLLLAIFIGTICGCVETRVMSNVQLEMDNEQGCHTDSIFLRRQDVVHADGGNTILILKKKVLR